MIYALYITYVLFTLYLYIEMIKKPDVISA